MRELKTVFISAPFAGDVDRNIARAAFYGGKAFEAGLVPYISHLIYSAFLTEDEDNRGHILDCCRAELIRRDLLWVCGTTITEGMRVEIRDWFALKDNEYPKRQFPWCVVWDGVKLRKTIVTGAEWKYRMEWVEKF